MKKITHVFIGFLMILIALQLVAIPILAQDTSPIVRSPEAPTAIVIQSISSQSNTIEWVILIQILAFLVLLTFLMSGTVQDRLRLRWRSDKSDSAESASSTD